MDLPRNVGTAERIVSTALGAAALAAFLARPRLARLPVALLAGALLFRGTTGRCPAKAAAAQACGDGCRGRLRAAGRKRAGSPEESWTERKDLVQEASEESFPASDPPSFNPGTVH